MHHQWQCCPVIYCCEATQFNDFVAFSGRCKFRPDTVFNRLIQVLFQKQGARACTSISRDCGQFTIVVDAEGIWIEFGELAGKTLFILVSCEITRNFM